jgi:DNA-binding LacI/PurR family transcriptional regulator
MVVWGEAGEGETGYCCVGTDNRRGGKLATEHLLTQGRRHIAYVGMTDIPELAGRYAGYQQAHRAAGVDPGPQIAVPLAFDPASPALREALRVHPAIDGVVAASDVIAMGTVKALSQCGRNVPEDVAVVGYDDVSLAAHIMPALTTIRQDLATAAETMIDLLFRRMGGDDVPSVRIPLELVRRQSA